MKLNDRVVWVGTDWNPMRETEIIHNIFTATDKETEFSEFGWIRALDVVFEVKWDKDSSITRVPYWTSRLQKINE